MIKLQIAKHPEQIFRVARGDPWIIRPPRGNNRFDIFDPEESVMTLYTGESPEAAWAEVLAPFRPDLATISAISSIPCDDNKMPSSGKVPTNWLLSRCLGTGKIKPTAQIIDITNPATIQDLRNKPEIAKQALRSGFSDLDDSALKAGNSNKRHLTQTVAAFIYNNGHDGIRYESRLGSNYKCIAGFISLSCVSAVDSKFLAEALPPKAISPLNSSLQKVASIMNLRLPLTII